MNRRNIRKSILENLRNNASQAQKKAPVQQKKRKTVTLFG